MNFSKYPELEKRSRELAEWYITMLFRHKKITLIEKAELNIELKAIEGKVNIDVWKGKLISRMPITSTYKKDEFKEYPVYVLH